MRKVGGLLLAGALLLPAGVIAAGPAGSATTGLTCTKIAGTVTWTPPVPNNTTKVKSNTTIKSSVSGCTGTPKITSGVITLPLIKGTTPGNCTSLIGKPTKITVPAGGSILWATTKTKSVLGVLTLTPAGLATYKASVKIASGQFAAKTLTVTAQFTPVGGGCLTKGVALKSATLKVKAGTKVTIK